MNSVKEMWLQEKPSDKNWIKGRIASYNARLGDFIAGGNRAPLFSGMKKWRRDILDARERHIAQHSEHTPDNSDFGCRHCHLAGWEVDTSRPVAERRA